MTRPRLFGSMLWVLLSLWVILEACGQTDTGEYGAPPSYQYFWVRPDRVDGFAEERRPGKKRCTWMAVGGDYRLIKGTPEEVACRLDGDWPECKDHVRPE